MWPFFLYVHLAMGWNNYVLWGINRYKKACKLCSLFVLGLINFWKLFSNKFWKRNGKLSRRTQCCSNIIYALFRILPNSRNQSDIVLLFRFGQINCPPRMYYIHMQHAWKDNWLSIYKYINTQKRHLLVL